MFSVSFDTEVVSGNMESQRSDNPAAENLFNLGKLEEILPLKEMQTALLRLQNHFSQRNWQSNATRIKHQAIHEPRLPNQISQDSYLDATKEENKREIRRVIQDKKLLTGTRALCSSQGTEMPLANSSGREFASNSRTSKQVMQDIQIKKLSERLEFLEKETKIMKQEFFEQVEEREKLVNEVYQHFQIIYSCLQLGDPGLGESGSDGSSIANTYEVGEMETKASSPRIVTRDQRRSNVLVLKEAPEII